MKYSKWCVILAVLFCCAPLAVAEPIAVEVPQRSEPIDFEREVLPVLRASCTACHSAAKAEARLNLESPQTILAGGEQGPAIVPGKSAESLLLKVAAHREESFMPPAGNTVGAKNLTSQQLGLLQLWIDQGAKGTVSTTRTIQWEPTSKWQPILAAVVTPDAREAIASRGNQLVVYRLPGGKIETKLIDPALPTPAAHTDFVRSLALDPSGQWLASGGFGEIKLWRRPTIAIVGKSTSTQEITRLAASADGRLLASASANGQVQVREAASDKVLHDIAAHQEAITGLGFSPDGKVLYTASSDKTLRAWSMSDGKEQGQPWQSPSPIRSFTIGNQGEWLITGGADGTVRVWSSKSSGENDAKPLHEVTAHQGAVTALAAAPEADGWFSAGEDGLVRRWQASVDKPVREWRHDAPVTDLVASSKGDRVASVGGGKARLWHANETKLIVEIASDPRLTTAVAESKGRLAIAKSAAHHAQQDIKSYEGTERRVMTTAMDIKKAEEELIKATKTRDEKKAEFDKVPESDAKKRESAQNALNEAETGILVGNTIIDRAKIIAERAVKAFDDAKQDLAAREELVKQCEAAVATATERHKIAPAEFRCATLSADGTQLVIGSADGALHAFAAEDGVYLQSRDSAAPGTLQAMCMANDRLFTAASGKQLTAYTAPIQWKLAKSINQTSTSDAPRDRVLSLAFSPDGQYLAAAGGVPARGGELKIFDLTGKLVREVSTGHTDTIFAARYSPDGRLLATASADRLVRVLDATSGELKQTLAGHTAHALGLSWHSGGQQVVSCGADRQLKLWDAQAGVPLRTMKGTAYKVGPYRGEVTAVAFLGDSEQYVAACGDGTIRLHRTTSENEMVVFKGATGYQYAVAATPDGQTIIAGGADGVLRVWVGQESNVKQTLAP